MIRLAANLSMLFTELPFLDRFGAAAKAGFAGVEYLFPYAFPKEQIAEQLLYVALEKHNTVAIAPAVHAGVQRALKLRHSVQVCGGGER